MGAAGVGDGAGAAPVGRGVGDRVGSVVGAVGAGVAPVSKSVAVGMMCWERLNLCRFGNALSCPCSSPIHSAMGTIMLSHGYLGMVRPRPT